VLNIHFHNIKAELRGFAPIGIVEWWNIGMMGFGKME
jgi:hypothetical protein